MASKRTRKWIYVAQEAKRLGKLGMPAPAIAKRLGLHRSTVTRWMQAGKVRDTRNPHMTGPRVAKPSLPQLAASDWATAVQQSYVLDATDAQLVTLAEAALAMARDDRETSTVRLAAAGRFQALVKQLSLVPRDTEAAVPPAPALEAPAPRLPRLDPRTLLQ